jgi:hypothetical protein
VLPVNDIDHSALDWIGKCGEIKAPPKKSVNKAQSKKQRLREDGVEVIKNNKLIITKILLFMSRSRVFVTPPALSVPPNAAFKAYLINTTGLCPTKCPPLTLSSLTKSSYSET